MTSSITAKNLTKIYQKNTIEMLASFMQLVKSRQTSSSSNSANAKAALNDVSFEFVAGDRIGIIGRNGAGKSTLLSILAGLTEKTSGSLEVRGQVTAVMTLGVGLREDLTGRENIYIDGEIQGKNRNEIDKVINEIIAFAELGEFIDYPLRTYSTGMKARLAFAMLVTIEPEILIIDEALSVGDAKFSQKATKKIKEICDKGKLVIMVSHGMQSIREMCNRCLWLENGKVVMDGEPNLVTQAYLEAIRKEDENQLLQKFHRYVGDFTYRQGNAITCFTPYLLPERKTGVIFTTGDIFALAVEATYANLVTPDLKLQIIRLDGFIIYEENLSKQVNFSKKDDSLSGKLAYEITFATFALVAGIYKLVIQLLDQEDVVAEKYLIIEMQTLHLPTGGKPALIWPVEIAVRSQSNDKVEKLCLDSTETM